MSEHTTVELHHEISGQGPHLLLIAGLGLNSGAWAGVRPILEQHYTLITVDNRGTGRSPAPEGPYTIDQMADDVADLLRRLDLGPVDAVGWSLGSSVLQALLIRNGALVKRGVLLNGFPSYTKVQDAWLDAGLMLRRNGLDPVSLAIQGLPWALTPRALTNHDALYQMQELAAQMEQHPTPLVGFEGQAAGLRVYDSRPDLPTVTNEVLVLTGAEDTLTPPSQSVEMAELIPNGHLQILPRGGHGMILEYPEDTLAAIRAFIDRD